MVKKLSGLAGITAVKSGIECIEVPGVQVILGNAQGFTEALVVDDLPGSEELDGFTDIRILDQAQNVVVGGAGFLFRSHTFVQICDDVSFYLKFTGIEGHTACCLRPDTNGVIHIIIGKSAFLDLFHGEVTGQLVNDGAQKLGAKVYLPELKFCGDNGAMIAAQGYYQYIAGHTAGLELNGLPTLPIDYE